MKLTTVYIGSLFLLFLLYASKNNDSLHTKSSTIVVCEGSYLKIKGSSNLNKFECNLDIATLSDSLSVSYYESNEFLEFSNTKLVLPNKQFNCGKKMINKDFHKLLNTDNYPEISLQLKNVLKPKNSDNCAEATVDVVICGIKNSYVVPVTIYDKENMSIASVMSININDFNLEPPKKLLGVIKVSSVIEIDLLLNFTSK